MIIPVFPRQGLNESVKVITPDISVSFKKKKNLSSNNDYAYADIDKSWIYME